MSGAKVWTLLLPALFLLGAGAAAQENPADWQVLRGDVQVFPTQAEQFVVADRGQGCLHVFASNELRRVSWEVDSARPMDYVAMDDLGGVWMFGDPISSKSVHWWGRDGTRRSFEDAADSREDDHKQNLLAFLEVASLLNRPFRLGVPRDRYVPAFGPNGEIAVLNDRKRLCVFDGTIDGLRKMVVPITGRELPDDRVLGHPRFSEGGDLLLDGMKGTYRRAGGIKGEGWEWVHEPSAKRNPARKPFPPPGIIPFAEWQGAAGGVAWSGSGFELLVSTAGSEKLFVLPQGHPLLQLEGKVRLGSDRKGRWWFEGSAPGNKGEKQILVYSPKVPEFRKPASGILDFPSSGGLLRQFCSRPDEGMDITIWARIADAGWMQLTGIPFLEKGLHPLELRFVSLDPPFTQTYENLSLRFDVDVYARLQEMIGELASVTHASRETAQERLRNMMDLEAVRSLLAGTARDTRDPELAYRCMWLLSEVRRGER